MPESCTRASCAPCTVNLLGAVTKGKPDQPGDFGGDGFSEAGGGVDAGADGGAPEGEAIDTFEAVVQALDIVGQHAGIARPLLAERDRRRVLHVGAADLDDVLPFLGFGCDGIAKLRDGRNQAPGGADCCRNAHGGREAVIGRLRHVDVIVRMNRRLAAESCTGELAGAVREHLVDVHVELGAAAGHPDMEGEHVVMLAGEDLVGDLHDQVVGFVVEALAGVVNVRGGFFQDCVRRDHLPRDEVLPDAEMFE